MQRSVQWENLFHICSKGNNTILTYNTLYTSLKYHTSLQYHTNLQYLTNLQYHTISERACNWKQVLLNNACTLLAFIAFPPFYKDNNCVCGIWSIHPKSKKVCGGGFSVSKANILSNHHTVASRNLRGSLGLSALRMKSNRPEVGSRRASKLPVRKHLLRLLKILFYVLIIKLPVRKHLLRLL